MDSSSDSNTIDLDESFKRILWRHKQKKDTKDNKENEAMETSLNKSTNFEAFSSFASGRSTTHNSHLNDTTILEEPSIWRQATDESFEAVERMCDKTARGDRFLKDLIIKADQTQLNDIEAPSGLWENTIGGDVTFAPQTSPVKMIGMIRPSTIIEESFVSDSSSSSASFQTASRYAETVSTEQYETANETVNKTSTSEGPSKKAVSNTDGTLKSVECNSFAYDYEKAEAEKILNISDLSVFKNLRQTRQKFYNDTFEMTSNPETDSLQFGGESTQDDDSGKASINFTFEDSLNPSRNSLRSSGKGFTPKSFDDDSLNVPGLPKYSTSGQLDSDSLENKNLIDLEKSIHIPPIKVEPIRKSLMESSSVIEISDEESMANEEDLNKGFSMQIEEDNNISSLLDQTHSLNISREFNDTIEEIEYIMQRGMKYMTGTGTTPKSLKNTVMGSAGKERMTPTQLHQQQSPPTPNTVISKAKHQTVKEKPPRSNPGFKKPIVQQSRIPQHKVIGSLKKQQFQFNHIVSPVGAYIKNTPTTPIIATIKSNHHAGPHPKAARGLDYGAKVTDQHSLEAPKICSSLPRKAYVSAEYKHVVDQRKPISMPGGDKIHRYLQSSKVPSVIRHEGKVKMNMDDGKENTNTANVTFDKSLADLSVMSGNVSLYTLLDAKPKY